LLVGSELRELLKIVFFSSGVLTPFSFFSFFFYRPASGRTDGIGTLHWTGGRKKKRRRKKTERDEKNKKRPK